MRQTENLPSGRLLLVGSFFVVAAESVEYRRKQFGGIFFVATMQNGNERSADH
jgi:hypothetical protein